MGLQMPRWQEWTAAWLWEEGPGSRPGRAAGQLLPTWGHLWASASLSAPPACWWAVDTPARAGAVIDRCCCGGRAGGQRRAFCQSGSVGFFPGISFLKALPTSLC